MCLSFNIFFIYNFWQICKVICIITTDNSAQANNGPNTKTIKEGGLYYVT